MKEVKDHEHGCTSNTNQVFRTFIGCKVKGLVGQKTFDGYYADILVFECGWGLAINGNGAHWTVNPTDIKRLIRQAKENLTNNQRELECILALAGET